MSETELEGSVPLLLGRRHLYSYPKVLRSAYLIIRHGGGTSSKGAITPTHSFLPPCSPPLSLLLREKGGQQQPCCVTLAGRQRVMLHDMCDRICFTNHDFCEVLSPLAQASWLLCHRFFPFLGAPQSWPTENRHHCVTFRCPQHVIGADLEARKRLQNLNQNQKACKAMDPNCVVWKFLVL